MKILVKCTFVIFPVMIFAAFVVAQQVAHKIVTTPTTTAQTSSGDKSVAPEAATDESDGPVYQIGGSVRPPVATYTPGPEFAKEASKNKFSGNVVVALIVDANGNPKNVHVLRGMGMGLDEKAVQAVQRYKFKPATKDGKPVAVYVNVAVNFRSF